MDSTSLIGYSVFHASSDLLGPPQPVSPVCPLLLGIFPIMARMQGKSYMLYRSLLPRLIVVVHLGPRSVNSDMKEILLVQFSNLPLCSLQYLTNPLDTKDNVREFAVRYFEALMASYGLAVSFNGSSNILEPRKQVIKCLEYNTRSVRLPSSLRIRGQISPLLSLLLFVRFSCCHSGLYSRRRMDREGRRIEARCIIYI